MPLNAAQRSTVEMTYDTYGGAFVEASVPTMQLLEPVLDSAIYSAILANLLMTCLAVICQVITDRLHFRLITCLALAR